MMVKQSLFCTDFRTDAFCIENTQLLLSKKQPRRGLVLTSSAILLPFTIPVKEYIVPTKKEPRAKYVSTRSLNRPPKVGPKNLTLGGRFFMVKYSTEFKLKVVTAYLNGEDSYKKLVPKYGIKSDTQVKIWVAAYQKFGIQGLVRSRNKQIYTSSFKQSVVESYLTSELSYQQIALKYGLRNPSLVARWKKEFMKDGVSAFVERPKGRPSVMKKSEDKTTAKKKKSIKINSKEFKALSPEQQRILELEQRLRYAEIEIRFLKELRRLRLEDARKMKESQESSVISEETTH